MCARACVRTWCVCVFVRMWCVRACMCVRGVCVGCACVYVCAWCVYVGGGGGGGGVCVQEVTFPALSFL